jgi:hypothetical protein
MFMRAGKKQHDRVGMVDVADGEFMLQKLEGLRPTVAKIEKQFGLRPGQLAAYRANNYSRKGRKTL